MDSGAVRQLERVVIARPGGNDTALVFDMIDPSEYREINAAIQKARPNVEQVMFVDRSGDEVRGHMAGGEFCGNATRALGYCLGQGKETTLSLAVSGSATSLAVTVGEATSSAEMPVYSDLGRVRAFSPTEHLVEMEGISHLVLEEGNPAFETIAKSGSIDEQKAEAMRVLIERDLKRLPAAGIILVSNIRGGIAIRPFVYVHAIDTFFFESACGSGSIAAGLVRAKREHRSVSDLAVRQPSGMEIEVNIEIVNGEVRHATIGGPVEILYDGALKLA